MSDIICSLLVQIAISLIMAYAFIGMMGVA